MFHISKLQTVSLILENSVWQNSDHIHLVYEIVPQEIKTWFLLGSLFWGFFCLFLSFFSFMECFSFFLFSYGVFLLLFVGRGLTLKTLKSSMHFVEYLMNGIFCRKISYHKWKNTCQTKCLLYTFTWKQKLKWKLPLLPLEIFLNVEIFKIFFYYLKFRTCAEVYRAISMASYYFSCVADSDLNKKWNFTS